jgi:hypothetical protein
MIRESFSPDKVAASVRKRRCSNLQAAVKVELKKLGIAEKGK